MEAGELPATYSAALGPALLLAPPHPISLAGLRGQGKG